MSCSAAYSPKLIHALSLIDAYVDPVLGKTTFIRQLVGQDFKHMDIGPQPTTEEFVVVSKTVTVHPRVHTAADQLTVEFTAHLSVAVRPAS